MAKEKISISVEKELLNWIDREIENSRFASRSHAFSFAVKELKKDTKEPVRKC